MDKLIQNKYNKIKNAGVTGKKIENILNQNVFSENFELLHSEYYSWVFGKSLKWHAEHKPETILKIYNLTKELYN